MKVFLILLLMMQLSISCSKKLESSSERMAETSTALQESTKQQMDKLLELMEKLTLSIGNLEQNFLTLVILMHTMQVDLNELAKVSAPVREMITQMNSTLSALFEKKESPDMETEDLSDLIGVTSEN